MINILLISEEEGALTGLKSGLRRCDRVELHQADTGGKALDMISREVIDLVVTDEKITDMTGLEFSERLVSVNPMTNCAIVSSLSPKGFHEATEGLGVLMQLPVQPDEEQAETLLQRLESVLGLTLG